MVMQWCHMVSQESAWVWTVCMLSGSTIQSSSVHKKVSVVCYWITRWHSHTSDDSVSQLASCLLSGAVTPGIGEACSQYWRAKPGTIPAPWKWDDLQFETSLDYIERTFYFFREKNNKQNPRTRYSGEEGAPGKVAKVMTWVQFLNTMKGSRTNQLPKFPRLLCKFIWHEMRNTHKH